jgi:ACS family hexuronate transporter-like MFS transporter
MKALKLMTQTGSRGIRWVFLSFAFAGTVVNYLDRQTLYVAAPVMRRELHFGDIEYSRIVAAFLVAYTVGNGLSGFAIDRIGTKWGYAICMLWWSAASVLHGFAQSAISLGVCRFLLGLGEAGNWPAAIKLVSEWFAPRDRALASGIFNSGSSIGAVVSPPLIAWIVLHFGWHTAFFSIGAIGLVWSVLWLAFYYTPHRSGAGPVAERPATLAAAPAANSVANTVEDAPMKPAVLVREPFVWSLTLGKVFFDPVWYFYVFWFPQYLSTARHFDMAQIGIYAWIPFLAAGIGNLAGGAASAWMIARGMPLITARKIALTGFAFLMLAGIPTVIVADSRASIALASVVTFGYCGCLANMLALPGDFYPRNVLGAIWGVASMGAGFGGMLFTLVTGLMIQHWSYTPAFILFALMPLVCLSVLFLITFPAAAARAGIRELTSRLP